MSPAPTVARRPSVSLRIFDSDSTKIALQQDCRRLRVTLTRYILSSVGTMYRKNETVNILIISKR